MRRLVIDVSHWDGGVDMDRWKSRRGLYGVIVKCGGNENGRYRDSTFVTNYDKAVSAGLKVGYYYYTTTTSPDEAVEDARHCLSLVDGRRCDLPIYIDVEDPGQSVIGKGRLSQVCLAFCRTIEGAGHKAGVYTAGSWWDNNLDADAFTSYSRWVAFWAASLPQRFQSFEMWQQGGMRLSDGDVKYDDVPGYTDCNWYQESGGEDEMPRNLLSYADAAAEVCDHFVDHDVAHGYSQPNRDGTSEVETITLSDGTSVSFQSGDRDCSRLMQTCYVVVGALPRGMHMWTGNEREILLDNGFVEVPLDNLVRGDVLWRAGHTEMYMGNGIEAGARRSEHHSIDGTTGDQDGGEIDRSSFVRSHWTSAYRCVKKRPGEGQVVPQKGDSPMLPTLFHCDGQDKVYYWDGSSGTMPMHVSPAQKDAIIDFWGLHGVRVELKKISKPTFDGIMSMCESYEAR